jgi:HK97 family phage major capsid protein
VQRKLNLQSGEKFPVQHREYKIDRQKIDQEKRTVEILFSTDDPAERWFGNEILDHSQGACDLRRLNDGGAFLKDHDPCQQIGVHENASISIVSMGSKQRGEGRALVRFAPASNPLAEQEYQDMLAGIRTKISVGYVAREMKLIEEDENGNETWLVTKWEPLENSLVAIPLDPACAAGRALEHEDQFPISLDRSQINLDKSRKRTESPTIPLRIMATPTTAEPTEKSQAELDAEERDRKQFLKEEREADRLRQKEIRAIAKRGTNVPDEVVEKANDDEMTVDAFRKLIMEKYWGNATPIETPNGNGSADIRVIGERPKLSLGAQFIRSKDFQEHGNKVGTRRSIAIDADFSVIGIRGKVAMAQRAGFTSSDLAAINIAPQQQLVALGVQRLTIMDLIAPGTTSAAAIPYPKENSYGTIDGAAIVAGARPWAKGTGERGVKPNWEPDLTTDTANVKKVAITSKVPDEFMSDFPGMQSYIDERMPFMVDIETEMQFLYGDGLGNNIKGITSTAGIQTRAYATAWADTTFKALTDIRVLSFFEPDGFAFHPYDWEVARLEKDLSGQYLAGGPYYIPYGNGVFMQVETFWGKPVVVSTSVAVGKPIAGCWKLGAQYFVREGMRLETTNANEDDFKRNLICIRAEHRLALAVYRPPCFVEITGGPART